MNAKILYNTALLIIFKDLKPFSKKVFISFLSSKSSRVKTSILQDNQTRLSAFIAKLSSRKDLFKHIKYIVEGGKHRIYYELADYLRDYQSNHKNRFIKIDLLEYCKLRSRAAMNLYEVLLSFKDTGKLDASIAFLRERLGPNYTSSPRYKFNSRFKSVVLLPAISELESLTRLQIKKFEIVKDRVQIQFNYFESQKTVQVTQNKEKNEAATAPTAQKTSKKLSPLPEFSDAQNAVYLRLLAKDIGKKTAKEAIEILGHIKVQELIKSIHYDSEVHKKNAYLHASLLQRISEFRASPPGLQSHRIFMASEDDKYGSFSRGENISLADLIPKTIQNHVSRS